MTAQRTHIVVIGGGYAGTLAANHLRLRRRRRHHRGEPPAGFRRANPAASAGRRQRHRRRRLRDPARRRHPPRRRQRRSDQRRERTVELTSGTVLDYDYLIYAVGSTGVVPSAVPGAAEFAYPIAEFEQAERLRDALDELHPDAPVTVVGAGLTGIETASELAEQGRTVTLVCGGTLGPSLSRAGPSFGGQVAAPPRCGRARDREGRRGPPRRRWCWTTARCCAAR